MKTARSAIGCAFLLACGVGGDSSRVATTQIRISVLPSTAEGRLQKRFASLVEHLAESTGYEIILDVPSDYEQFLKDFGAGRSDLAWFGGLTFTQAHARFGAEPLVTRDIDVSFTSHFITRKIEQGGSAARSLEAFRDQTFAFGPSLSTSGHLMPRAFLERRGIVPEQFFAEVRHSSGHDQTIDWVFSGVVDLAAVSSVTLRSVLDGDSAADERIQIVDTTTPYQNYVWAIRPELPRETSVALRDAFLALDPSEPAHEAILRDMEAGGFLPIDSSDYGRLEVVAKSLGLLGGKQ